jgi:hypothetical protein
LISAFLQAGFPILVLLTKPWVWLRQVKVRKTDILRQERRNLPDPVGPLLEEAPFDKTNRIRRGFAPKIFP